MCRSIKPLFNFEPPTTEDEVRKAALQFVRKISGFSKPSAKNEAACTEAVEAITLTASRLLTLLETTAPAKNRALEAEKAKARGSLRFAQE